MITLKEAFTTQKQLATKISILQRDYLSWRDYKFVTLEHHLVAAGLANEDIETKTDKTSKFSSITVLKYILFLTQQYETLAIAIEKAKLTSLVPIDALKATNVVKQGLLEHLAAMVSVKSSQSEKVGQKTMKDDTGRPAIFDYSITERVKYDFDKKNLYAVMKTIELESQKNSTDIERALIDTMVDYTPVINKYDDLDSILEDLES